MNILNKCDIRVCAYDEQIIQSTLLYLLYRTRIYSYSVLVYKIINDMKVLVNA